MANEFKFRKSVIRLTEVRIGSSPIAHNIVKNLSHVRSVEENQGGGLMVKAVKWGNYEKNHCLG